MDILISHILIYGRKMQLAMSEIKVCHRTPYFSEWIYFLITYGVSNIHLEWIQQCENQNSWRLYESKYNISHKCKFLNELWTYSIEL